MKFSLGIIIGAALGGYIMNNLSEDQRKTVSRKASTTVDKVKGNTVVSSVSDNVGDVTEAASQRVAGVVDAAGVKVADAISTDTASTDTASPGTAPAI